MSINQNLAVSSRSICCNRIWENYRELRRCDSVLRAGFYRYGINYDSESIVETMKKIGNLNDNQLSLLSHELSKLEPKHTNKPESVNEHSFGAIEIARGIARFFPEVLDKTTLERVIRVLHYHDLPEKDVGDIPDDGDRDEVQKNANELSVMEVFVANWPSSEREDFLRDYKLFQDPFSDQLNSDDRHFAQFAYICDKLDALLKAIVYEANGHLGFRNAQALTDREIDAIEKVGNDNLVDCWSYQFLHRVMPKDFPHYEVFAGILKSAILAVRNSWFKWAKDITV